MGGYAIIVNMTHIRSLVVGGGKVGSRKLHLLLESGGTHITVVDPCPKNKLQDARIFYLEKFFEETDLEGYDLVFAATSSPETNKHIANLCRKHHIFCNTVEHPDEGSFTVPAQQTTSDMLLAVSTHGTSPALAARLCHEMEDTFSPRYHAMIRLMKHLRPLVLASGLPPARRNRLLRALALSRLPQLLATNQTSLAHETLSELLPVTLHPFIPDLLHDCF